MTLATFWLISGTLALILLTYQDIKHNMVVDDRRNYFLQGLTFALLGIYTKSLLWLIGIIVITIFTIIVYGFAHKKDWVGSADVNTFSWVVMGLTICNPMATVFFFISLLVITLLTISIITIVKYKEPLPFYPNIMAAWILTLIFVKVII